MSPFTILIPFWATIGAVKSGSTTSGEILEFHEPSYCAVDEYFDVTKLKCITCDSDKNLVPSHNGFSCVCNERSRIKKWNFASFPVCEPCKENEMPSRDQLACVSCSTGRSHNETSCEDFRCPPNSILVEKATGEGTSHIKAICEECSVGTEPSLSQTICTPCKQTIFAGQRIRCSCQEGQTKVQGVCFANVPKNWADEKSAHTITYENGLEVDSQFLQDNLLQGIVFCKMGNQTSCQSVANMCAMVMYDDTSKSSPCAMFKDRKRIPITSEDIVPWMYYGEGDAPAVLSRKRISTRFNLYQDSPMSHLNLTATVYHPDGTLKSIRRLSGHSLQLCPSSWTAMDSNFRFGVKYFHECRVPAQQLLLSRDTEFLDVFLRYKEPSGELLHAVPVLLLNLKSDGHYPNKQEDKLQWQFVRRFFLLDKLSGAGFEDGRPDTTTPKMVRYAKSITLNVKLQESEGKIFVPYLAVEYGELTKEDIERNEEVHLSFQADYQMENNLSHALEVCMGVFSGLAVVWAGIRAWSHSKRSGRVAIDFATVVHLVLFTCGNLANVFFLIVFCACLSFFVFFKGQSAIHVLLPTESQEEVMKLYLIFAFVLKIVEIVHLIYNHITIDIFFVDWERPRARNLIPRTPGTGLKNGEAEEEQPVSIWRTYFVANEWNEIQTKRKLNVNLHLLVTVFILKVIGLEHWAASDPEIYVDAFSDSIGRQYSFTCRFAIGGLVYISAYIIQRVYMGLLYERFVKNGIQEFVDMCSMANISVFILALENYGFYIHGRSAHGFADTDMQNIINQLQREEEDLVGHRGLLPGTDQQTFEMTVPAQLRSYYKKVMMPLKSMSHDVKRITISTISGRSKTGSDNLDRSVQAYHNMNRFLAAFLEHALKDLDYEVRDKLFTECLLGIEFAEPSEKGVFYSDNGHSFDNVLFYGNEFTLFSFDILLFSFIVVIMEDYLVAGVVTAVVAHIVAMIRNVGGRKNLAKKTLIDERFLI